jgi:hypothetical protein
MTYSTETIPERGFATGELVVLRPVLEDDLPELAMLLAANCCEDKPQPWTLHRVKKLFEDKDSDLPGLWGEHTHYFAVVRNSGGLVGFLRETNEEKNDLYWNRLYIGERHADRDELGPDAAKAYLAYKQKWSTPWRITFETVQGEPGVAHWLEAAGFELEIEYDCLQLHQGQPKAHCCYTWWSEFVLARRVDDGPVAGEEN